MNVTTQYHVPRSQVWQGSRGRQSGHVHLYVDGKPLCGRAAWYARPPYDSEVDRCPRCERKAEREEIAWP